MLLNRGTSSEFRDESGDQIYISNLLCSFGEELYRGYIFRCSEYNSNIHSTILLIMFVRIYSPLRSLPGGFLG
jgi:hypothetical protein